MTTTEIINKFLGYFKLTPRHLATFAITSLIVFLLPTDFVKVIIPIAFHDYYRPFFGLIFLLSVSGLIVELGVFICSLIRRYLFVKKGKIRLSSLTEEEKNILRKYITGQSRTHHFSDTDGATRELEALEILIFYGDSYHIMEGIPYGISDWALKYLKCNSHLLLPCDRKKVS